jgi:hypothetical protein
MAGLAPVQEYGGRLGQSIVQPASLAHALCLPYAVGGRAAGGSAIRGAEGMGPGTFGT